METSVDMTVPDVAVRLGVSRITVWRWIKQGVFPNAYQLNPRVEGSPWRIPEDDVISFEEERKGRQGNDSQANDN